MGKFYRTNLQDKYQDKLEYLDTHSILDFMMTTMIAITVSKGHCKVSVTYIGLSNVGYFLAYCFAYIRSY